MNIIKLKDAKALNLTYYYTGKKCKNGHDSLRLVKGGACKECKKEYKHSTKVDIKNSLKKKGVK